MDVYWNIWSLLMMRGAIVRQFCVGKNKQTNKLLMMNFKVSKDSRHAWSLVYYFSEVFKACLESGLLL